MSNHEIKNANDMIEKLREMDLPKELQQRIYDTANGMALAAETMVAGVNAERRLAESDQRTA